VKSGEILPLFGLGGMPLEHFVCRHCDYVNDFKATVCENCGSTLLKSFESRVKALKEAIDANPADGKARYNLGVLYQDHGYQREAMGALEEAVKISPDDGASYRRLAGIYNNFGQCEQAVWAYENTLRLSPDDAEAQYFLALNLEGMGRYREAIASYEKAIESKPDYAIYQYYLGKLLLKVGKRKKVLNLCHHLGTIDRRLAQKLFSSLKG
jgi:tetratricopeptide (TPR) repeat protein